jgi:broad specificity phosphatase PhoE
MTNYCTIYLARHGETKLNAENRVQGQINEPLSPNGILQAQKLKETLSPIEFNAIYSSTLSRAYKTALIIAQPTALKIKQIKELQERNYGEMDGIKLSDLPLNVTSLMKNRAKLSFSRRANLKLVPHYESDLNLFKRASSALLSLSQTHLNQTILIVSHDALMRTLLIHLGYFSYQTPIHIQNTGYIIIQSDGIKLKVIDTVGINH